MFTKVSTRNRSLPIALGLTFLGAHLATLGLVGAYDEVKRFAEDFGFVYLIGLTYLVYGCLFYVCLRIDDLTTIIGDLAGIGVVYFLLSLIVLGMYSMMFASLSSFPAIGCNSSQANLYEALLALMGNPLSSLAPSTPSWCRQISASAMLLGSFHQAAFLAIVGTILLRRHETAGRVKQ